MFFEQQNDDKTAENHSLVSFPHHLVLSALALINWLSLSLGLLEFFPVDANGTRSLMAYPFAILIAATVIAMQLATLESAFTATRRTSRLMFVLASAFFFWLSSTVGSITLWKLVAELQFDRVSTGNDLQLMEASLLPRQYDLRAVAINLSQTSTLARELSAREFRSGGTCGVPTTMGAGPIAQIRQNAANILISSSEFVNNEEDQFSIFVKDVRALAEKVDGDKPYTLPDNVQVRRALQALQVSAAGMSQVADKNLKLRSVQLRSLASDFDSSVPNSICPDASFSQNVLGAASMLASVPKLAPLPPVQIQSSVEKYLAIWKNALGSSANKELSRSNLALPVILTIFMELSILILTLLRRDNIKKQNIEIDDKEIIRIREELQEEQIEILSSLLNENLFQLDGQNYFILPLQPDGFGEDILGRQNQKLSALRVLATSRLVHAIDTNSVWVRFQNWVLTFTRIPLGTYSRLKRKLVTTGRSEWLANIVAARIEPRAYQSLIELLSPTELPSAMEPPEEFATAKTAAFRRTHGETQIIDIFLSYSNRDRDQAEKFADQLRLEGFSVWWDPEIFAGETYDEVIDAHLRSAKAVVALWSPRSVSSRWVRAEASYAVKRGILVPVFIEPCDLPLSFMLIQTLNLAGWDGDRSSETWHLFVSALGALLSRPAHTPVAELYATRPKTSEAIDLAFWSSIQATNDPEELRAYIEQFPNGHFRALANIRLERLTANA
jgi:TIR domain